jgi:hypothetical protein
MYVTVLLLMASSLSNCVCADIPSMEEELELSDNVFVGQVIERRPDKWPVGGGEQWLGYAYTFRVMKVWKGGIDSSIEVVTGVAQGDCGFPFKIGELYFVCAAEEDGKLYTSLCGRTAEIEHASEDILKLPEPKLIVEKNSQHHWLIGILLAVVVALSLHIWRTSNSKISADS